MDASLEVWLALAGATAWLLSRWALRAAPGLEQRPRWAKGLAFGGRWASVVAGLAFVALLVTLVLPRLPGLPGDEAPPALLLVFGAVALLFGLGLGPAWFDLFAGGILRAERRLGPGLRAGDGEFEGVVVSVGWRSTRLRGAHGVVDVPNRRLVHRSVWLRRASEHELVLTVPSVPPAEGLRQKIEDVVLASAYVPLDPKVRVRRDPLDPHRWRIRARLLEPSFAAVFDAEIVERIASALESRDPASREAAAAREPAAREPAAREPVAREP